MFDKSLSFSEDMQVIRVIYNEEKTKRFILLKSVNGYYKYTYGSSSTREGIEDEFRKARKLFKDAFIIVMQDGKRIE